MDRPRRATRSGGDARRARQVEGFPPAARVLSANGLSGPIVRNRCLSKILNIRCTAAWMGTLAFAYVCVEATGFEQCNGGQTPLRDVLTQQQVALVFSGWIARREHTETAESVTFNVERVWKAPRRNRL